jgi:hypothetical protein
MEREINEVERRCGILYITWGGIGQKRQGTKS